VHRLEARVAAVNGRGNGALQKIGAVQEAILRKSFHCNGQYIDQLLYAILDQDWRASRHVRPTTGATVLQAAWMH
jgi:RimJ/RimL family protein N-acetyltransferase